MIRTILFFLGIITFTPALASDNVKKTPTDENYPKVTNLPTLYINTNTGSDPEDTETYLSCTIRWVDTDSTTTYIVADADHGIRGRGNSTWNASKKPWRIKFNDKQKFLGKGYAKSKSWVLLANTYDKSLMRNAITSHLGKMCGLSFCPAAKFVDLVMNGTYRGTYQVSDQIEVADKRVQAVDENGDIIPNQNKTTWLLEYCNSGKKVDDPFIILKNNNSDYGYYHIKNPDQSNNDTTATYTIDSSITEYINDTWAPLLMTSRTGKDYCNPYSGYRSQNDAESLINWYVATEITANWDGFYSIYNYRYPGTDDIPATKMFWGPMWDNDLAFGNHTETYSWLYFPKQDFYKKLLCENNFPRIIGENAYRRFQPLVNHMWDDPWFALTVQRRLNDLVDGGLESFLLEKIEDMRTELTESATKNFEKWDIANVDNKYACYSFGYTWAEQVNSLKSFISSRIASLQELVASKNVNNRYFLEDEINAVDKEIYVNVVIKRTAKAGQWTSMCLPVAVSSSVVADWFGTDAKVFLFSGVKDSGDKTVLLFTPSTSIIAGMPCLVMPTRDLDVDYTFLSTSTTAEPITVKIDSYSFTGEYSPQSFDTSDKLYFKDGKLTIANDEESSICGMSSYITIPDGTNLSKLYLSIDGTEYSVMQDSSITHFVSSETNQNSNCQRKFISNGGLVIIRNGIKYNANGQRIE